MNVKYLTDVILNSIGPDSPPQAIKSLIEAELFKTLSKAGAVEAAEDKLYKVIARLNHIKTRELEKGGFPDFAFNSSSPTYIQGAYFVEPRDSADVQIAKKARARYRDVLDAIKELSFQQFEVLCAKVLSELGASDVARTPRTSDQGIDFYGKLNLGRLVPSFPLLRLEDTISVWLIGQAKHYPSGVVQVSEVRELVGAILLARHREFTLTDIYPNLMLRSCDPVVGLFITSGTFTRGGQKIGNESGLICKDGLQLATFIADRRKGIVEKNGELGFSQKAFFQWLDCE